MYLRSRTIGQEVRAEENVKREAKRLSSNALGDDHTGDLALMTDNPLKTRDPVHRSIRMLRSTEGDWNHSRALLVYREYHS